MRPAVELKRTERATSKGKKAQDGVPSHILHKKHTTYAGQYGISPKDFPKNALAIVEKLNRAGYEATL